MNRTQFTFYESFYKALSRIRRASDRAKAYDLMVRFALYGEEPDLDALPDAIAIALELIRPNLEASRRKALGGMQGKKEENKTLERYPEDTGKIPTSYREQEKEKEQGKEKEKVIDKEREKVREQDRGREEAKGKGREKESPLPSYYPERVRGEPADALLMETWNRQRRSWGLGS